MVVILVIFVDVGMMTIAMAIAMAIAMTIKTIRCMLLSRLKLSSFTYFYANKL